MSKMWHRCAVEEIKQEHEELMENNETYRQIALSQLSEEELNIDLQEKKKDRKEE